MSDERAQKKTFRPYILTVACCACMVVATVGLTNAYGVFLTPVAEALGTGRGAISVHSTLCNLFTGLMAPLSIRLMKKFGLRPMVFAGMVLYSASSFLMAFASSVWQLNLLGALKGAGCSMYYFTIVTIIIGNWYFKLFGRRGRGVFARPCRLHQPLRLQDFLRDPRGADCVVHAASPFLRKA